MTTMSTRTTVRFLAAMTLAGCASGADAHSVGDAASEVASSSGAPLVAAAVPAGAVRFTVASSGNAARFRVREQLMGHDLPNDAVGETQQVSGSITLDGKGVPVAGQSQFVVQTGSLKSDSDRRDGYVRGRLLETDKYPTVVLVPTAMHGIPAGAPAKATAVGPVTFEMVGDLTVRGVTHPTTWRVTARQDAGRVTGSASTRFTFADFAIDPPRVPILLSVADTIALEYDFTLTRDPSTSP